MRIWGGALWSPSYFAGSCEGAPIAVIRKYIESNRLQAEDSFAVRALHPRPKRRGFPRNFDKLWRDEKLDEAGKSTSWNKVE
jgi:Transposase IS200 like